MSKRKPQTESQLANLKKNRFKDRKLASEAGKKSGRVKRELKTFRQNYEFILGLNSPAGVDNALKTLLPQLKGDIKLNTAICLRTAIEAANGNMQAVKEVREVTEGLLTQDLNFKGEVNNTIKVTFVGADD